MKEITLREYIDAGHTQQSAADALSISQGAIWQMLKKRRDIRLHVDEGGSIVDWYEVRRARRHAGGAHYAAQQAAAPSVK